MPRIHFVKKARKKTPVCKKGESYYWWKNRMPGQAAGVKRYSKEAPKPSQTCGNPFYSSIYAIQEDMDAWTAESMNDLQSLRDDCVGQIQELLDETQEKHDNMPDGLQQGPSGELLQERVDALQQWIDALEGVDLDGDTDEELEREENETDADYDQRIEEEKKEYIDQKLSDLRDCNFEG